MKSAAKKTRCSGEDFSRICVRDKCQEEITLPVAEISDNETAADKITSYVYVIKGNNRKTLIGGTYKFTDAGEYRIRYVAYDAHQNYTVVEFTVTCR